jgi:hypothetical protein
VRRVIWNENLWFLMDTSKLGDCLASQSENLSDTELLSQSSKRVSIDSTKDVSEMQEEKREKSALSKLDMYLFLNLHPLFAYSAHLTPPHLFSSLTRKTQYSRNLPSLKTSMRVIWVLVLSFSLGEYLNLNLVSISGLSVWIL